MLWALPRCGSLHFHIQKLFFPSKKTVSSHSHSMNFDWLVIRRPQLLLAVSFMVVFFFNQKTGRDVCIKRLSPPPHNEFKTLRKRGAAWKEQINTAPTVEIRPSLFSCSPTFAQDYVGGELKYTWQIRQCFCQWPFRYEIVFLNLYWRNRTMFCQQSLISDAGISILNSEYSINWF